MEFAVNKPIFVDVYVAKIPNNFKINAVYCKERQNEIDLVLSEKVRTEKYFVWKLLEYVLKTEFNLTENEFSCINGKWELKNNSVLFSLTEITSPFLTW